MTNQPQRPDDTGQAPALTPRNGGDVELHARTRIEELLGIHSEPPPSAYDNLDPKHILRTSRLLATRIGERFPDSGLYEVSLHLVEVSKYARETSEWISRPIYWLRVATWSLVVAIILGLILSISVLSPVSGFDFVEFVGALEAGINDVVLIGAGIFFLVTLETRIKRHRAMRSLHKLRSLAHIVDMHQLTKSPERLEATHRPTRSSPRAALTPFELSRYLDYCSEMLSLIGKVAALYIQDLDDGVALAAVTEIEELTTGLSRKIWQKLIILRATHE